MHNKMNYLMPVLIALVVAFILFTSAGTFGQMEPYYEESRQWCDERGGELYNAQSLVHGGLHCELENGTTVHMSGVVDWTEA